MKVWFYHIGTVLALAFVVLTFINASWLADSPRGHIKHRGAYQLFDHAGLERDTCTADRAGQPGATRSKKQRSPMR